MTSAQEFEILLVEDDPGHAMLVQMNMKDASLGNPIVHVDNGQKALDYVHYIMAGGRKKHLLLLLDLNLPILSGYEVLERLKSSDETRQIPIIVLTTTQNETEIQRCYDLGCNVFLTKPVEYGDFQSAIKQLGLFLSIISVPDSK